MLIAEIAQPWYDLSELPQQTWNWRDRKPLEVIVHAQSGANISASQAVIDVYNAAGAQVVVSQPMVGRGTKRRVFSYLLVAGTDGRLSAAGDYDAYVVVTLGEHVQAWHVPITVKPAPP